MGDRSLSIGERMKRKRRKFGEDRAVIFQRRCDGDRLLNSTSRDGRASNNVSYN